MPTERGRGLNIIGALADELDLWPGSEGGLRIWMVKVLRWQADAPTGPAHSTGTDSAR